MIAKDFDPELGTRSFAIISVCREFATSGVPVTTVAVPEGSCMIAGSFGCYFPVSARDHETQRPLGRSSG